MTDREEALRLAREIIAKAEDENHIVIGGYGEEATEAICRALLDCERERDVMFKGDWAALNLRVEVAERDLAAAREALREIKRAYPNADSVAHMIASAALHGAPPSVLPIDGK